MSIIILMHTLFCSLTSKRAACLRTCNIKETCQRFLSQKVANKDSNQDWLAPNVYAKSKVKHSLKWKVVWRNQEPLRHESKACLPPSISLTSYFWKALLSPFSFIFNYFLLLWAFIAASGLSSLQRAFSSCIVVATL